MVNDAHPAATGGSGPWFENRVASSLAVDLIVSRQTEFGGVIVAIETQTGPKGFDDLQVSLELPDRSSRTLHAQCRRRQPFTGANARFAVLVEQAAATIADNVTAFATGQSRLAIIVDHRSPGYGSMMRLCELACDPGDHDRFLQVVEAHRGKMAERWDHCLRAAGELQPEELRRVLASLEVRSVDLDSETSRDWVALINRLADRWSPPSPIRATNLANALQALLAESGTRAGMVDMGFLRSRLGPLLPTTLGAATRREKLRRRRESGHRRTASRLMAIGLDRAEAEMLATQVLASPPSVMISGSVVVVTGQMGVGKTTELERLHRAAIERALDDDAAPIPLMVEAREVGDGDLVAFASRRLDGLGDPSAVGVHLIVDGLDEAGTRIIDLDSRIATLQDEWGNSTVILGTRPQRVPRRFEEVAVGPLGRADAKALMRSIAPDVSESAWRQDDLAEILCLPLFAIRFALDHRRGRRFSVSRSQLIESVGQQAIEELGDSSGEMFALLVRLACLVVNNGGRPVAPRSLEATGLQVEQLSRSRVTQTVDGKLSFQIAALTEWFAAEAILSDTELLDTSMSGPVMARRWRYVLVQALLRGSDAQVDAIMPDLLTKVPATAAWVHHEAQASCTESRTEPVASTALEAGERIRHATKGWTKPWPYLIERRAARGELPDLGVAVDGLQLMTAWHPIDRGSLDQAVPLAPGIHQLADIRHSWCRFRRGIPRSGETWPWEWTLHRIRGELEECLQSGELLADIEVCWPELAWSFAHRMLDQYSGFGRMPPRRSDLEAVLARYRSLVGEGETTVSGQRGDWTLAEGEAFVADLRRLGIVEVAPPCTDDQLGTQGGSVRTTEQLLAKLHLTTKTALDIYQALVDRHLPALAPELNTYQLLPACVVGFMTPADPKRGFIRPTRFRWHIDPLPAGADNQANWGVWHAGSRDTGEDWETRDAQLRELRPDLAECITLSTHYGGGGFQTETPACSFALELLKSDLAEFEWLDGPAVHNHRPYSARPRYT